MKILVVVDMQNDFIDGALGTPEARRIVPAAAEKIRVTSVLSRSASRISVSAAMLRSWTDRRHSPPGSCQSKSAQDRPIEEIELVGLCTDICVISNALVLKTFLPEVPIAVDAACCAGVTPQSHANALAAMKMCQIKIYNE